MVLSLLLTNTATTATRAGRAFCDRDFGSGVFIDMNINTRNYMGPSGFSCNFNGTVAPLVGISINGLFGPI